MSSNVLITLKLWVKWGEEELFNDRFSGVS